MSWCLLSKDILLNLCHYLNHNQKIILPHTLYHAERKVQYENLLIINSIKDNLPAE